MRESTLHSTSSPRARFLGLFFAFFIALFIAGCGGGGSSGSGSGSAAATPVSTVISGLAATSLGALPVPSAPLNAVPVTVESRWANGISVANQPYVSVTVCVPKADNSTPTQCQTIDHILVDTGSVGLRILSSALSSSFQLNMIRNASNLPVLSCVTYLDGSYTWGPLVDAYVQIGGETISNLPMQVVGQSGFNAYGSQCSSTGSAITTAAKLGAKGIIGVGLWAQDCGSYCAPSNNLSSNGRYFSCTTNSCTAVQGTTLATASQVQNPVALFSSDNNGLAMVMAAPTASGQSTATGTLYFGLGTQSNNAYTNAYTVLRTDASGNIQTTAAANSVGVSTVTKYSSFIDSGSNGLFFDSGLTTCTNATYFDCPASATPITATLKDATGATKSATVTVSSPLAAFSAYYAAIPQLAGNVGNSDIFDWGLPFFYGRTVVIGIEGKAYPNGFGSTNTYTGPYFAF